MSWYVSNTCEGRRYSIDYHLLYIHSQITKCYRCLIESVICYTFALRLRNIPLIFFCTSLLFSFRISWSVSLPSIDVYVNLILPHTFAQRVCLYVCLSLLICTHRFPRWWDLSFWVEWHVINMFRFLSLLQVSWTSVTVMEMWWSEYRIIPLLSSSPYWL